MKSFNGPFIILFRAWKCTKADVSLTLKRSILSFAIMKVIDLTLDSSPQKPFKAEQNRLVCSYSMYLYSKSFEKL